ncbi:MAG: RloB family protein [Bacteroidota bacterium]
MARIKSQKRRTNPVFYVFCEGKTEKLYLELLNRIFSTKIRPILLGQGISDDLISRNLEHRDYDLHKDETFAIYDLDVESVNASLSKISTILLVSNPCIELWFLLHYKDQTRNISSLVCKNKEIQNSFCKNYKAGKPFPRDMQAVLEDNLLLACERAKKLNSPSNPSSTVYKLIEELVKRG